MNDTGRVAAFFDIDGTILPAPSLEWRFARWLAAQGLLDGWQIAVWVSRALLGRLSGRSLCRDKSYLAGLPCTLAEVFERSRPATLLRPFPDAAQRIAWHAARGHQVVLVSGTLWPLATILARQLGTEIGVSATRLAHSQGSWTGDLEGEQVTGREKARALGRIAEHQGLSLRASFAYGNQVEDAPMLAAVGHPVAVNPQGDLEPMAARSGWRSEFWSHPAPAEGAAFASLREAP